MTKITATGLVTLATLSLLSTPISTNAHAASWHSGTPKVLRGKWRGATKKIKQFKYSNHATVIVKAHAITNLPALPPRDGQYSKKLHYKKTGNRSYTITGRQYANAPANGSKITFKVKIHNHHKITFRQVQGRADGNGTFYRY